MKEKAPKLKGAFVGSYIHAGNKIATLVALSANVSGGDEAARNVAMQAAAMSPIALDENGVDADTIAKEIEIAKDQLRQEGKPEAMLDNIAKGKLNRFFKDNTLVNQDYIKDNKLSVAALDEVSELLGSLRDAWAQIAPGEQAAA